MFLPEMLFGVNSPQPKNRVRRMVWSCGVGTDRCNIVDVLIHLGLAGVGIALLCFGADRLVSGAAAIAVRFGVSGFVIGITLVAYGTSTPELAASIQAAMHGEGGVIIGNVVGSNIANIGMVLGAAAVLVAVFVGRCVMRAEVPIVIGVSVLLVGVCIDGVVDWVDGIILVGCLAGFMVYTMRRPRVHTDDCGGNGILYRNVGMVALGAVLLYAGAILTVDNSVAAAELLGVPPHIIGITVIAVGTSMPEMVTTVVAVHRGRSDIGVANIIGSNILNVLFVLGVTSIISNVYVGSDMWPHYMVMMAFAGALFFWWRGRQARWVGPVLAGSYVAYLVACVMYI